MSEKKGIPVWGWVAMGCGCIVVAGAVVLMAGGLFVARKAGDFVEDFEANPARTAAELLVRANPELDLVSTDDDAGTMTIRNNETGETATLDFADIAEGRFSWTTASGESGGITFDGEDGVRVSTTDAEGNEESVDFSASEDEGLVMKGDGFETRIGGQGEIPDWVPLPAGATTQGTFASSNTEGEAGAFSFTSEQDVDALVGFYREAMESAGYTIETSSVSASGMRQEVLDGKQSEGGRTLFVTVATGTGVDGTQVIVKYEQQNR